MTGRDLIPAKVTLGPAWGAKEDKNYRRSLWESGTST